MSAAASVRSKAAMLRREAVLKSPPMIEGPAEPARNCEWFGIKGDENCLVCCVDDQGDEDRWQREAESPERN